MRDYYMPETPITDAVVVTNADRIRAMTDEELAHFLAWHWNKKDYGLEWLKHPAEQKVIKNYKKLLTNKQGCGNICSWMGHT